MLALVAEVEGAWAADEDRIKDLRVRKCEGISSAKLFLQSRPAGVYTCARAKASAKVSSELPKMLVEWSFHLQRLSAGIISVDSNLNRDKLKLDKLKMATQALAAAVMAQWRAVKTEDGMLSVLWYPLPASDDYGVAVHICLMPTPKCPVSTVLIYGEGRANARCKHSRWIEDRVPIETHVAQLVKTRGEPIHEVLLSKAGPRGDRLLLEGLITNFFVVKDCKLYTADGGILQGSTRELVLKACDELSIPVVLEAPKLSEQNSWQAAFVTSAVRVVIDVTRILFAEEDAEENVLVEASIPSDTSGFTQKIRDQIVSQHMYLG
ncbi:Amino-transferase class IV [Phytophthora infestans]|uniref:Amino-transferase class IV n=1 Tax=Phytophthora infestans TaxID=4787 RepID=A0A8S9U7I7_PHYIN|nr:Amino-transferase class IV [Phytophthora infestans]